MNLELHDRIAVVTGASAGIGRATAALLAAEGATVVAVARRKDRLDALSDEIEAAGGPTPLLVAADLLDANATTAIHDSVRDTFGRVDILVNVAGAGDTPGVELTDEIWNRQFDLNFHQKRRLTDKLLPMLKASGRGRVVNFAGVLEPLDMSAARAAVAACTLWSKALAVTTAREGVTVNTVMPGRVNSEQVARAFPTEESRQAVIRDRIPAGRFGTPEEVAALVAFLVSGQAAYITGATVSVDGGMRRAI